MSCSQGLPVSGLRRMLIGPSLIWKSLGGRKAQFSPILKGDRVWYPSPGALHSLHLEIGIDKQLWKFLGNDMWLLGRGSLWGCAGHKAECYKQRLWTPLSNRRCGWELLGEQQVSVRSTWFTWAIQQEKLGGSLLQFVRMGFGPSLPLFGKKRLFLSWRNQGTAQSYKLLCVGGQKGRRDAHASLQRSLLPARAGTFCTLSRHLNVSPHSPVTGATFIRYHHTCIFPYFCFMFSNQDQSSNWFLYEDTHIILWGGYSFSLRQLLSKTDYFFHWVCSLVSTNQIWICSV